MNKLAFFLVFLCLSALALANINDASGSDGSDGSGGSGSDGSDGSKTGSGSGKDDDSKCSKYTACGTCNADSDCGWCASGQGRCLEGDITGPSEESETCNAWSFGTCYDNSVCGNATGANLTCTGCQAIISGSNHCGLCRTIGGSTCANGTLDGPLGIAGNCKGTWYYDTCIDSDKCADITNCSLCVANSECGWCDGTCLAGTNNGPDSPSAQCAVWLPPLSNASCLLPCNSYPDCATCLIEGHCGYCQVNNTYGVCQEAALFGPLNGTCSGKWVPTETDLECPVPSDFDCSNFGQNCTQCLGGAKDNDLLCDWCETTQTCIDASAPDTTCDDRKSGSCDSTCSEQQDCEGCLSKSTCGWCDDQCVAGNATAPLYAPCLFYSGATCTIPCSHVTTCAACAATDGCGWCADATQTGCLNATGADKSCKSFSEASCPGNLGCENANCDTCGHDNFDHCTWCEYSQYGRIYQGCYAENPTLPGEVHCGGGCTKSLSGGKIFGIVFAVIVVVFGGGFAAYVLYRRRERQRFERLL